jgi:anti-sigma regulatory factor (Ser/Thr protein kinase)
VVVDAMRPRSDEAPEAAATGHLREWRFPSTATSVRTMRHELRSFLAQSGLPEPEIDDLLLAACEAAANGIEHARHPAEPFFEVVAEIDGPRVRIVLRDYGRWTPARADPGARGRGLQMMTMLAAVSLTSGPHGTTITLRNLV